MKDAVLIRTVQYGDEERMSIRPPGVQQKALVQMHRKCQRRKAMCSTSCAVDEYYSGHETLNTEPVKAEI